MLINTGYMVSLAVFLTFIADHILILTLVGLLLIVIVGFLFRFKIKKKSKRHEVVRPVNELLGNVPERLDELNQELKPFGFCYEPYQDIFFSLMHPWQRELGYCWLYDEASAAFSMIIDCEPITFEYNGRRWLIEFWKGQYGMTTGGEVGIYYTSGPNLNVPGVFNGTFYHCVKDEDRINMSFAFRKNGNLLFTRSGYHWWLTGFKLGEFSKPSELSMDIELELYDKKMVTAFVNALRKAGYKDDEFYVQGIKVYIHFEDPHRPQPISRTSFTEFIMQRNNESLCNAYKSLTEEYSDTLDKLVIVRNETPQMYSQIIHFGKPKAVYESFDTMKNYLDKE